MKTFSEKASHYRKKTISIVLAFTILLNLFVMALPEGGIKWFEASAESEVASGTCGDNLTWTLDTAGTLTISGSGKMTDWRHRTDVAWCSYTSRITSISIGNSVSSIGDCAFDSCNITKITIPSSVSVIGEWAFASCTNLRSISFPISITHIGDYAFFNCSSLKSITLPRNVNSLGDFVFFHCSSLQTINCEFSTYYRSENGILFNSSLSKLLYYPSGKPETSYTIPSKVTTIGKSAFASNVNLKTVNIPSSVTVIEDNAFEQSKSLTTITIPASVTSIGDRAFNFCSSLKKLTINCKKASIGTCAFEACSKLSEIFFSYGVNNISSYAFRSCDSLNNVILPASVNNIGSEAFYCDLAAIEIQNSTCAIDDSEYTFSDSTIIIGYTGSTAQKYADKYDRQFVAIDANSLTFSGTAAEREQFERILLSKLCYQSFTDIPVNLFAGQRKNMCHYDYATSERLDNVFGTLNKFQPADAFQRIKNLGNSSSKFDFTGTISEYLNVISNKLNGNFDKKIWTTSSITYRNLYNSFIGDWKIIDVCDLQNANGLYAVAFQKGNQIVIAYRGSDQFRKDWVKTDFKFALDNELSGQFSSGLNFYDVIAEKYPSYNITLTGHSLGGAVSTYVSTARGVKTYSVDGAVSHVIDLSYLDLVQNVNFTGVSNIAVTNYTDHRNGSMADLVQHDNNKNNNSNKELHHTYEEHRTTNQNLYDAYGEGFYTHEVFSTLNAIGSTISLTGDVKKYTPENNWSIAQYDGKFYNAMAATGSTEKKINFIWSVNFIIETFALAKDIVVNASTGCLYSLDGDNILENIIDLAKHLCKSKGTKLYLGTTGNDTIKASSDAKIENIIFGGNGNDIIDGSGGPDTIIPGSGSSQTLNGQGGNDIFIVDYCGKGATTVINDQFGVNTLILRGFNLSGESQVKYTAQKTTYGGKPYYLIEPAGKGHKIYIATAADISNPFSIETLKTPVFEEFPVGISKINNSHLDKVKYDYLIVAQNDYDSDSIQLCSLSGVADYIETKGICPIRPSHGRSSGSNGLRSISSAAEYLLTSETTAYESDIDIIEIDNPAQISVYELENDELIATHDAENTENICEDYAHIYYYDNDGDPSTSVYYDSNKYYLVLDGDSAVTCNAAADASVLQPDTITNATCDLSDGAVTIKRPEDNFLFSSGSSEIETTITVLPQSIFITGETNQLTVGDSITLSAALDDCTDNTIEWYCSDENVLSVSTDGNSCTITAVAGGNASVYAVANANGITDVYQVTVTQPAEELVINNNDICLYVGASEQLSADYLPVGSVCESPITWSSSDPLIASVTDDGTVTALSEGSCVITAVSGNLSTDAILTVSNEYIVPVEGIVFVDTSVAIGVGESCIIDTSVTPSIATNQSLTWHSSDPQIASVSEDGVITALAAGSVEITVTTVDGNFTDVCSVTVTETTVSIEEDEININYGEDLQLDFDLSHENISTEWSSSDETVVTVDDDGRITAVGVGTAEITLSAQNGSISDKCTVTVLLPAEKIVLSNNELEIAAGETFVLTAGLAPLLTTDKPVINWSSSDDSVASVDQYGNITGKKVGNAIITAQHNELLESCTVTVIPSQNFTFNLVFSGKENGIPAKVTLMSEIRQYAENVFKTAASGGNTLLRAAHGTYSLSITKPGHTSYIDRSFVAGTDTLPQSISLYAGDINADNSINAKDQAAMTEVFGLSSTDSKYTVNADFNEDGYINAKDRADILANFNKSGTVVE